MMSEKVKLLVCPLVSSDFERAVRCIKSCYIQEDYSIEYDVNLVINSLDELFVRKIVDYCDKNNIKYVITKSDGSPSNGKNTVFEHFCNTDFTHMTQLDGDDFFYPTFVKHVERHLKKYPGTDVLSTIPCDSIYKEHAEGFNKLNIGLYTSIWGDNYQDFRYYLPWGRDPAVDNISNPNYARLILFSKKVAEKFRYDKEIIVGEDLKIHFDFLLAFQRDEISYWFTTASDMWVRDTCSFGIQKKFSNTKINDDYVIVRNDEMFQKVKNHVLSTMEHNRTGPAEVPIDVAPNFFFFGQKMKFIDEFYYISKELL
jgi:hypothetical protein